MAHGPRYRVAFRRRREGRTDYKRRLALLKSGEARAVVRGQNRNCIVQLVGYTEEGDRILAQAEAQELGGFEWQGNAGNVPSAYLTGLLAGHRALENGVDEAVLDIGLQNPQPRGRLFAALAGLLEAGLEIPHSDWVLPDEDRLNGSHINDDLPAQFEQVKERITGAFEGGA